MARRQLMTIRAAADQLQLDEKTIRRYVSRGKLTGYRVGARAVRLDAAEVEALARPIPAAKAG